MNARLAALLASAFVLAACGKTDPLAADRTLCEEGSKELLDATPAQLADIEKNRLEWSVRVFKACTNVMNADIAEIRNDLNAIQKDTALLPQ